MDPTDTTAPSAEIPAQFTTLEDQLIYCDTKLDQLAATTKALKAKRAAIEAAMLEDWLQAGKQKETRRGRTLYRSRQMQCSTKSGQSAQLLEAIKAEGLDDFHRDGVVIASLKSWIRENSPLDPETGERDYSQIPANIINCLNVFEQFTIRTRQAE